MLVSAGESLIDLIQRPSDGPNPLYEAAPGGSPYNCAYALARLGAPAGYLCPISGDAMGKLLRKRVGGSGLRILIDEPSAAPTSLACVSLGPDGQPEYQFYRTGTADRDISTERLLAAVPETTTLFNTGSLALTDDADAAIWIAVAEALARRDMLISVDPNVRPLFVTDWNAYKARMSGLFGHAAIIKISDEDLGHLDLPQDPGDAAALLLGKYDCRLVALTYGSSGAVIANAGGRVRVPVYSPPVVADTVGAGDTFMGGLLAELHDRNALSAKGLDRLTATDLAEIGRFASTAAGLNCAEQGCVPPTRQAVLETIGGAGRRSGDHAG